MAEQTRSWKETVTQRANLPGVDQPNPWLNDLAKHYTDAVARGDVDPPHIDLEMMNNLFRAKEEGETKK